MKRIKFRVKGPVAMRPESVGLTWPSSPGEDEVVGGVFVMRICGPLEHRASCHFDSYECILSRFEGAMLDDCVSSVLLQIDSPGGDVSGLQETVKRMLSLKIKHGKKVVAYADDEAYSAAYAIACVADEIYLPEGGGVGSVGVIATVTDRTKMTKRDGLNVVVVRSGSLKADGHPDIPIDDGVRGRLQSRVDELAGQFFDLVSRSRGEPVKNIRSLEGQCVFGANAVNMGMADAVSSFDEVLSSLTLAGRVAKKYRSNGSIVPAKKIIPLEASMNLLEKRVKAALAALNGAKTAKSRTAAMAAWSSATSALIESKMKQKYKKVTEETESEEVDAEDVVDETDEESASSAEDDDEDEDEDDMVEDDEVAKAALIANAAMKATGHKTLSGVAGALSGFKAMQLEQIRMSKQLAKLEGAARAAAVDAMLAGASIPPSTRSSLRAQGLKDPTWLKGYLSKAPKVVRETDEALLPVAGGPVSAAGVSEGQLQMLQTIATATGRSIEDLSKDMINRIGAPKAPGF